MKTLKDILNEGCLDPTNIYKMDSDAFATMFPENISKSKYSYTEVCWFDLNINLSKAHQKHLNAGYIDFLKTKSYLDESDKKREIEKCEKTPYAFNKISANILQMNGDKPCITFTLHASDTNNNYNGFKIKVLSIKFPKEYNKPFTESELKQLCYPIFMKLKNNTLKMVKYMAKNWCGNNNYVNYDDIIKL